MIPARGSNVRVWLIPYRAGPSHKPEYHSCLVAGNMSKPIGEVESIEVPSRQRYGQWVEADSMLVGDRSGVKVELSGRYARDLASDLLKQARGRCANDVQLHISDCQDPTDFQQFEKVLILENASTTKWSIGLSSDARNDKVDETASLTGTGLYEVRPLSMSKRFDASAAVIDMVTVQESCCADCQTYFLLEQEITCPEAVPHVLTEVGGTWHENPIDSCVAGDEAYCIALLGKYVVVFGESCLHYALRSDVDNGLSAWTKVTTGFQASVKHCWGLDSVILGCGDNGYIHKCGNVDDGVECLDAGVATGNNLYAIHALNPLHAIAVGGNGAVIYTHNQTSWRSLGSLFGIGIDLTSCWMLDENVWFVGDTLCRLWYTENGGTTWTLKKDFS